MTGPKVDPTLSPGASASISPPGHTTGSTETAVLPGNMSARLTNCETCIANVLLNLFLRKAHNCYLDLFLTQHVKPHNSCRVKYGSVLLMII